MHINVRDGPWTFKELPFQQFRGFSSSLAMRFLRVVCNLSLSSALCISFAWTLSVAGFLEFHFQSWFFLLNFYSNSNVPTNFSFRKCVAESFQSSSGRSESSDVSREKFGCVLSYFSKFRKKIAELNWPFELWPKMHCGKFFCENYAHSAMT